MKFDIFWMKKISALKLFSFLYLKWQHSSPVAPVTVEIKKINQKELYEGNESLSILVKY